MVDERKLIAKLEDMAKESKEESGLKEPALLQKVMDEVKSMAVNEEIKARIERESTEESKLIDELARVGVLKNELESEFLASAESISPEKLEKAGCLTDIYVQDKQSGKIHRLGTDPHDAIWVDENGTLHYMNMQNGDGCDGDGDDEGCGYRFCASDCGVLEE